jgi:hypothetical protein
MGLFFSWSQKALCFQHLVNNYVLVMDAESRKFSVKTLYQRISYVVVPPTHRLPCDLARCSVAISGRVAVTAFRGS